MATSQRGGRVGRKLRESVVILIGQEDALDQYFMRNPEAFFEREVEAAVLNPYNSAIMMQHLHCCAAEIPLTLADLEAEEGAVEHALRQLTLDAVLLQSADGSTWFASRKYPQRLVNLRGGGTQLTIIDGGSGEIIGEMDSERAIKECHPGAVYLHRARTWLVDKLDFESREVIVHADDPTFFTRPMSNKNTTILAVEEVKESYRGRVSFGSLRVTERVTGYQKRNNRTSKLIATQPLDLPEQTIETTGFWLEIPPSVRERLEQEKYHFMGAIHALEHAMIALFPLLVLCDRNDIGGISCPTHEQTEEATIFVYDGHSGGVGLAESAYEKIDTLLAETRLMISSCDCENGCPSCVHSPKCGSGNRPIDKIACLQLLEYLLQDKEHAAEFATRGFTAAEEARPGLLPVGHPAASPRDAAAGIAVLPERYGVFDLETIRSADEVGGWGRAEKMGMSVGVVYDSQIDGFVTYLEHEVDDLVNHLQQLDLVVGFNNKRFDNRVLSGYSNVDLMALPTLDLLEEVSNHLGYRLSLNQLAEHTLNTKKTADGLQALAWYKEGKIDLIRKYCRKDVELTRDLLHYGLEFGHFLFQNKAGQKVRLPILLEPAIKKALQRR